MIEIRQAFGFVFSLELTLEFNYRSNVIYITIRMLLFVALLLALLNGACLIKPVSV